LVIWNQASKLELETGESNGSGVLELSKIIFRCPNLKKLQLVLHDYNRILYQFRRDRRNANRGNMKDCRESMQKFLDIHKGRFRNNKAPAVSVYYFAHLGGQRADDQLFYDYSNSTGEKRIVWYPRGRDEWLHLEGATDLVFESGEADMSD
jgi:hypothetical protein